MTTLTEHAIATGMLPRQGSMVGELLLDVLIEPDLFEPVPAEVEHVALAWALYNCVGPEIASDPVARRAFFLSLSPALRFRLEPHLDARTMAPMHPASPHDSTTRAPVASGLA